MTVARSHGQRLPQRVLETVFPRKKQHFPMKNVFSPLESGIFAISIRLTSE